MIIHNADITGSLRYNGIDISDITGSEAGVGALNAFSSSILSYTASNDAKITALNAQTASILSYTSSNDANIAAIYTATSSLNESVSALNAQTASILSYTSSNTMNVAILFATSASLNAKVNGLNSYTSSANTRFAGIEASTASLNTFTSSINSRVTTIESKYATTGSNTFTGQQYISNTTAPAGFSNTTASVYTDGGMQVTKDAYFSSSLFIKGNLTVFGTQSVSFITSSQLNISTNLITVNTATPSVRFGGLAVYDSGSTGTGLTGSLLWDSQNNVWIYTNPSGSSYDGGMVLMGPPNYSTTGNEVGITTNALAKGAGSHHMTSSGVFDVSGSVGIGTSTPVRLLEVYGTALSTDTPTLRISSADSSGTRKFGIEFYSRTGADVRGKIMADNGGRLYIDDYGGGGVIMQTNGGTGDVFIGETSDGYTASNRKVLGISGTSETLISFRSGSAAMGYIFAYASAVDISSIGRDFTVSTGASSPSEKFRILQNGNVGIGTTTPSTTLQVDASGGGLIRATRTGAGSGYIQMEADGTNGTLTSNNTLYFNAGGGTKMTILSGGNVGIGTTSPLTKLHVDSTTGDGIYLSSFQTNTGNANTGASLFFGFNDGANNRDAANIKGLKENGTSGDYASYMSFATRPSGGSVTERMRITSGGNVGIGTTSPSYTLDVSGTGRFTSNLYTSTALYINTTSAYGFRINSEGNNGFYNRGGSTAAHYPFLLENSSGALLFQVQGNGAATFSSNVTATQLYLPSNAGSSGFLQFNYSSANVNSRSWRIYNDTYAYGDLSIAQSTTQTGSSYNYLLTINPQGNVGIGTTSPDAIFHIAKSNAGGVGGQIVIDNPGASTVGNTSEISFLTDAGASGAGTRNARILAVNENAGNGAARLELHTWNGSASAARMTILSGGEVGIGTTNPTATLDLYSDNVHLRLANATTGTTSADGTRIYLNGSDLYVVNREAANIQLYTSDTERMRITSAGYVYINATSNPLPDNAQPQLGILAGSSTDAVNIKHTQNGNNTLNIWQTGTTSHNAVAFYKGDTQTNRGLITVTTSGTTYNSVSDYRLKENVVPLENGLDRLMQLKPSKFNWIETGNESEGFIAHELQEYFPDAVTGEKDAVYSSTGNIKPQSVDYGRITPLLVKAIQELKTQNDALLARIEQLENK